MAICPACQTENKPDAKFCKGCGKSLAATAAPAAETKVCPTCATLNPGHAKFCGKCGFNFATQAAKPQSADVTDSPRPKSVSAPQEPAEPKRAELGGKPCPVCGAPCAPAAKFCKACGHSFEAAPPPSAPPLSALRPPTPPPLTPASAMPARRPPPAPHRTSQDNGKSSNAPIIIAIAIMLAIAAGGSGYWYFMQTKNAEQAASRTPSPTRPSPVPTTQPPAETPSAQAAVGAAQTPPTTSAPSVTASPPPAAPRTDAQAQGEPEVRDDGHEAPAASGAKAKQAEPQKQTSLPPDAVEPEPPLTAPLSRKPQLPKQKQQSRQPLAAPSTANNDFVAGALDDGDACMAKKKYDCAITDAKSALRIEPGNARAQSLKQRAETEQKRALESITIN